MENQQEKDTTKIEILEAMNKAFSRMEEKMVTKDDFQNFKMETRQRFDKVDDSIKELNENVEAVIEDYHPRIDVLEEKVFGKPTLV